MFSNYVENGIYSMLATNVLTTASTVSANTIAIASVDEIDYNEKNITIKESKTGKNVPLY